MMNYIGYDNKNEKLQIGDICTFRIDEKQYEGMVMYDESVFAFVFEMENDKFPTVLMSKADLDSIEKVCCVTSTILGDRFEIFRELYNKPL